jgi:hypothetical protein
MNQSSLLRTLADLDASRAGVEKVYNELLDWQQKLVGQDDPSKPATKLMHTMNLDHRLSRILYTTYIDERFAI